jgi:hypothetical protein
MNFAIHDRAANPKEASATSRLLRKSHAFPMRAPVVVVLSPRRGRTARPTSQGGGGRHDHGNDDMALLDGLIKDNEADKLTDDEGQGLKPRILLEVVKKDEYMTIESTKCSKGTIWIGIVTAVLFLALVQAALVQGKKLLVAVIFSLFKGTFAILVQPALDCLRSFVNTIVFECDYALQNEPTSTFFSTLFIVLASYYLFKFIAESRHRRRLPGN